MQYNIQQDKLITHLPALVGLATVFGSCLSADMLSKTLSESV